MQAVKDGCLGIAGCRGRECPAFPGFGKGAESTVSYCCSTPNQGEWGALLELPDSHSFSTTIALGYIPSKAALAHNLYSA